jgi:HEAT repeat protein
MTIIVLLLAFVSLPVCAFGQEKEYQGENLAYWIERTRPEYGISERLEALRTLRQIGMMRGRRARRDDKPSARDWIAAKITPTLCGLLKDNDPTVRAETALAICWMDRQASNEAIPALAELLDDQNEKVRKNAASALVFRGAPVEPAIPALVRTVILDNSPAVRHEAALALRTDGPKGIDALSVLLENQNREVRRAAIGVFENSYPGEPRDAPLKFVPRIVALLQDESPEIRKSAAIGLVRIGDAPAEVITQLLRHQDVEVRRAAASTLLVGMLDQTKKFRPEMIEFMEGEMSFCQTNASLLSRAGPKSIPILMKLLDDDSPMVRGEAASALGELGPAAKDAAGPLKRLLKDLADIPLADLDDRVCHHAALALNQILGDRDYREGLPHQRPDGL